MTPYILAGAAALWLLSNPDKKEGPEQTDDKTIDNKIKSAIMAEKRKNVISTQAKEIKKLTNTINNNKKDLTPPKPEVIVKEMIPQETKTKTKTKTVPQTEKDIEKK